MTLPVYLYGHPILRKISPDITPEYPNLKKILQDMWATMYESDGIGLAAPQVGINARIVVIDVDVLADTFPELAGVKYTLINPHLEVIEDGRSETRDEACLSLPGIHERVSRIEKVKMNWVDENFEPHEEVFEGFLSRVIQHEYDHLEGKVFIDHISAIRKQLIKSKLNTILNGKAKCSYRTKGYKK